MASKKKASDKGKRYSEQEKEEILRFVEGHGRGGASAAAKKFGVSPLTISSWRKQAGGGAASKPAKGGPAVDKDEVLRALARKGFKVVRLMNALTGEILEERIDPKVERLGLEFGAPRGKADDGMTYVVQSSGQILVTMTLDRLLAVTGTKP